MYKGSVLEIKPDSNQYKSPTGSLSRVASPLNKSCNTKEEYKISGELEKEFSKWMGPEIPLSHHLDFAILTQKNMESRLKPPKKRYIINGEFQSNSDDDTLSIDYQDSQTRNACSALLELAEVCPNGSVSENSSLASAPEKMSNSIKSSTIANGSHYSNLTDCLEVSKPECTAVSSGKQEGLQNLSFMSLKINNDRSHSTESTLQQEQPLDLCKAKEKSEVADGGKSKTITTSNQRLIDHFVDKFLCDTPLPHKFYKSHIVDPAFCKLFSKRSIGTSSEDGKITHSSAFTLSVAIESAVDKAYSRNYSKSSPIPESNLLIDCVNSETQEFDVKFKSEVKNEKSKSSVDKAIKEYRKESSIMDRVDSLSKSGNQDTKQDSNDTPGSSSSKYYCKLLSPPKKSSVWCNIFMNEQQTKNSVERESNLNDVNNTGSDLSSPARRSSQRACKGRRYQALFTEGLLQSPKERKGNGKKAVSPLNKVKNKINSLSENHLFNSPKRKKRKDSFDRKKHSPESLGLCPRILDVEEEVLEMEKQI